MAINIRLSPTLEARARTRSDDLGISINAIVSVALDAYLNVSPHSGHLEVRKEAMPGLLSEPEPPARSLKRPPGPKATKKERQEYTAFQRAQKKLSL